MPVVQELEQKNDLRFNNLENQLNSIQTLLEESKDFRDKIFNEE